MDEARIAYDNALQSFQLGAIYRPLTSLADYLAPALHAMLRRVFSLNLEARA